MTEVGTPTQRSETMTNITTRKELKEAAELEEDLRLAKMYFLRAKHPHMKQAYYKLWYSIVVIKHKSMMSEDIR